MFTDEMNFDLTPVQIKVTLSGKAYVLKEASASDVAAMKNQAMAKARIGKDGQVQSLGSMADQEAGLVALCLYEADADGNASKSRVNEGVIKAWPARVVSALFSKAARISGLVGEETREEVEKRIGELQDKLASMGDAGDGGPPEKKPQTPTDDTSESAES